WAGFRFFPLTPLVDLLPPIPQPIEWALFLSLVIALAAAIAVSRPRPFIWLVVALVSLMVFLDQERLQPWVYQYGFMLAILGLFFLALRRCRGEGSDAQHLPMRCGEHVFLERAT